MSDANAASFSGWAVVEVMGHQKYAGLVSEVAIGGVSFIRVDVPETEHRPAMTKLLSGGAIFAITPVTEAVAREAARRWYTPPPIEFTPRLTYAGGNHDDCGGEGDGDGEDDPGF